MEDNATHAATTNQAPQVAASLATWDWHPGCVSIDDEPRHAELRRCRRSPVRHCDAFGDQVGEHRPPRSSRSARARSRGGRAQWPRENSVRAPGDGCSRGARHPANACAGGRPAPRRGEPALLRRGSELFCPARRLSEDDVTRPRTRLAFHEAGHAVLSASINDMPRYVSISPRRCVGRS